jgi:hypothetical protein
MLRLEDKDELAATYQRNGDGRSALGRQEFAKGKYPV